MATGLKLKKFVPFLLKSEMRTPQSSYKRVQQWEIFARQWHLIDARSQCADRLADRVAQVLQGAHKPIYHPESDCGDHVVVVNTRHVALHGFDWKHRLYTFRNLMPKGKVAYTAAQIHEQQPNRVLWMCVLAQLDATHTRRRVVERLHLFPDEDMPSDIRENISNRLPGVMPVPRTYDEYTEEEKKSFPRLFEFPNNVPAEEYVDNPDDLKRPLMVSM